MSSSALTTQKAPTENDRTVHNLASELKPQGDDGTTKVKPCCVCKDEKAARDKCMLFSSTDDPAKECDSLISQYRSCMAGYGFQVG